jgi:hypothetical protein
MAIGFPGVITFTTRDRMVAPRLAYVSRSWCTTPVSLKNNDIRDAQTHVLQERRASARRRFPNRVCDCHAMTFRVSRSPVD